MLLHHCLSLVSYGSSLLTHRMSFWAVLAGCCEVTTFFLNNLCLLRELNAIKNYAKSKWTRTINTVNGVLLWVSFIVFRLVLFSYWLWWFWQETEAHPQILRQLTLVERYINPAVIGFLLCISTKWFVSLTRGTHRPELSAASCSQLFILIGMLKALGLLSGTTRKKSP